MATFAGALLLLQSSSLSAAAVPSWNGPALDYTKPLGGLKLVPGAQHVEVYHGDDVYGGYNHAAMLDYHNGTFLLAWKNGPNSEDKDGQRIVYSQSKDGVTWDKIDASRNFVLFPSLTTKEKACAMFVGPPIHINGRQYVGASPGEPTDAAQGAQFCLWPDPIAPRNCGPPDTSDPFKGGPGLLMREVVGYQQLGPIFWASATVPATWADASKAFKIPTLPEMADYTKADIAGLTSTLPKLPCPLPTDGNLKCEACLGGCGLYDDIHVPPLIAGVGKPKPSKSVIGNERAHYTVPSKDNASYPDVILYRSGANPFLYASVRAEPGQASWPTPVPTNISNDESNLNTGRLPDGRVYLVNNAVFEPKNETARLGSGPLGALRFRDPVVVSSTVDGYSFGGPMAVITCTQLPNNSTCSPRVAGTGKNPGPSYPQGMSVVAPAPEEHRGFYVVATNNKEDVWLTKLDFSSF